KMCRRAVLEALSMVLILSLGLMQTIQACPHPCACYLPTEVHCTFRSLASVPAGIPKHAERINLGFNSIHSLTESSFAGLKKLELLMIHGNDIPKIPNHALKDLTSLQVLKMSYNKLRVITEQTFQGLSSLMRLHVDHNKITFIHPEAFIGLTSLRLLHLEGNLLQQLHPNTFVTFSLFNFFKTSTIKHLYVSENSITTLSPKLFQSMPLLENIYLHGNPWSCDCSLKWLLDWNRNTGGVLKCKKDRTYEGGQLCPKCSTPRQLAKLDVLQVNDMSCFKPVIHSPLKQSGTESWENSGSDHISLEDYQAPFGTIRLNMTDEHGNKVDLQCQIQRPGDSTKFQWSQTNPQEIAYNITLSLDFICPMERANYEKLWKLIAYYSEVPLKLQRGIMLSKHPILSYRYKQGVDHDSYYYTGVKAHVFTEPSWLMQSLINIQLNRRQASTKHVMLSFFTQFSETIEHEVAQRHRSSWVMIENNEGTKTAQSVIAGTLCQLTCTVHGSDTPSIQWVFPDGTLVNAPYHSRDNRISVSSDGKMVIKAVTHSDSGLYYCIAQVHDDTDTMLFIISVQDAAIQSSNNEENIITKYTGESLSLPCSAIGIPDAQLSWILPNNNVLNGLTNTTRVYVLKNGTLFIKDSQVSDSGYYRCVAVNQQGADSFSVKITVAKKAHSHPSKKLKGSKHPSSNIVTKIKEQILEDEEGSGKEKNQDLQEVVSQSTSLRASTNNKNMIESGRTQARLNKKLRKKFKFRKNMQKAEGSSTAEGRRKFSSRKRINVTNRQIDPQHWAKILAKVRGNSVSKTTVSPALNFQADSASTNTAEGSSTDDILSPEEGLLYITTTSNIVKDDNLPATKPFENEKIMINRVPETGDSNQNVFTDVASKASAPHTTIETLYPPVFPTSQSLAIPKVMDPRIGFPLLTGSSNVVIVTQTRKFVEDNEITLMPPTFSNSAMYRNDNLEAIPKMTKKSFDTTVSPSVVPIPAEPQTVLFQNTVKDLSPKRVATFKQTTSTKASTNEDLVHKDSDGIVYQLEEPPVKSTTSSKRVNAVFISTTVSQPNIVMTTTPTNVKTKTTSASSVNNSRAKYPWRRPYGRRRLRPNRFRPRPEPVPSRILTTTESSLIQPPFVTVPSITNSILSPLRPKDFDNTDVLTKERKKDRGSVLTETSSPTIKSAKPTTVGALTHTTLNQTKVALGPVVNTITRRTSSTYLPKNINQQIPNLFGVHKQETTSAPINMPFVRLKENILQSDKVTEGKSYEDSVISNAVTLGHDVKSLTAPVAEKYSKFRNTSVLMPTVQSTIPVTIASPVASNTTTTSPFPLNHGKITVVTTTTTLSSLSHLTVSPQKESINTVLKASDKAPVHQSILDDTITSKPIVYQETNPVTVTLNEQTNTIENFVLLAQPTVAVPFRTLTTSPIITSKSNVYSSVNAHTDSPVEGIASNQVWTPRTHIRPSNSQKNISEENKKITDLNHTGVHKHSDHEQFKETHAGRTNNNFILNPKFSQHPGRVNIFNQSTLLVLPKYVPARGTIRPPVPPMRIWPHYFVTNKALPFTNKPEITAFAAKTVQGRKVDTPILTTTTTAAVPPVLRVNPHRFSNRIQSRPNVNSRTFGSNYFPDRRGTTIKLPGINQRHPYYPNSRTPFIFNHPSQSARLANASMAQASAQPSVLSIGKTKTFTSTTTKSLTPVVTTVARTTPSTTLLTTAIDQRQAIASKPSSTTHLNVSRKVALPFQNATTVVRPSTDFRSFRERPKITTDSLHTVTVQAGMDAVFPCDTTGEPTPFLTWTKVSTGAVVVANTKIQRFEVLKNGTFIIRNVKLQDRGQYLCTAQNQYGIDKMVVTLAVLAQQPRMLVARYKDATIYLGETVIMECTAEGMPPPQISWILPDRTILRTVFTTQERLMLLQNGTLRIKEANFPDRGIYKCIASNAAGADTLTVRLHVAALPPIIQQLKRETLSVVLGQSIHIDCTAKAAPLPNIRWVLYDGTQIRPSQFINGNLFVFPNGTLYIRNITPRDGGNYECVATNVVGAARRTVSLTLKKLTSNAKITGSSPQKTDVTYGSTLSLDCTASGDPGPRIIWRLPSKKLVDSYYSFDHRIKVNSNGTLVVQSVTDKDAGDYLCVARNKMGDDFVILKVNVMMKPAKIEYKQELSHKVMHGSDLKVDCIATGLPNPEISWALPDGTMINSVMQSDDSGVRTRRFVVFNNGTLYFNDVGTKEEGDYTCYAVNKIGKDEMRVHVKVVAESPVIKDKSYSVTPVPYGDAVTILCAAKGEPTPRITWLSPTNRVIPALSDKYQVHSDGTLFIQKAQRSDNGNYTCIAQNTAGEDKKIVKIEVNVEPPKINGHLNSITAVKEIATKDTRKLIHCKAEGIPFPRVMWVLPENVVLPAPYYGSRITIHRNGTLDIKAFRKKDTVQLVCIARNEGGEARLIVLLSVVEDLRKPTFQNPLSEKFAISIGDTVSLNCSAEGRPLPEIVWVLPNGTQLLSGKHLSKIYHGRDGTLHITNPSAAEAGIYRCTARNEAGYVERTISLDVGQRPTIKNHYTALVSIINGENLRLHCVTQGNPRPHISWTLPTGMVLNHPQTLGHYSLMQNGSLTVLEASVYDRGSYTCKAVNEYGTSILTVPVIVIAYPPRITNGPTPVTYTRLGNTVHLNCMAIGIPKPEVTWELPDKIRLTTATQARVYGNKYLHPQGSLILQKPSQRDTGFYQCTAKNLLGSDSKTTYVHVF
uniref:Matrix remodeling associated 5 n=1 Tax=Latimeria chalumnae TaxID=7897 RepID=H2ZWM5_LATCH